jgi:hypothetical protein
MVDAREEKATILAADVTRSDLLDELHFSLLGVKASLSLANMREKGALYDKNANGRLDNNEFVDWVASIARDQEQVIVAAGPKALCIRLIRLSILTFCMLGGASFALQKVYRTTMPVYAILDDYTLSLQYTPDDLPHRANCATDVDPPEGGSFFRVGNLAKPQGYSQSSVRSTISDPVYDVLRFKYVTPADDAAVAAVREVHFFAMPYLSYITPDVARTLTLGAFRYSMARVKVRPVRSYGGGDGPCGGEADKGCGRRGMAGHCSVSDHARLVDVHWITRSLLVVCMRSSAGMV